MEMLILFVGVVLPLSLIGVYSLYRTNKEDRNEQSNATGVKPAIG